MIRAVVFDLDHTLYDRYGTISMGAHLARKTFAVKEGVTDAQIAEKWIFCDKSFVHFGFEKMYGELARSGIFTEPLPTIEQMISLHYELYTSYAVPYDFAIPAVKALKERGFAVALITNGRSAVQRKKLRMLDMVGLFDEVTVGGEFGLQKPHKEIFLDMAQRLGVDPSEMMYVGDNPVNDIKGSREAGCVPVWVRTTEWNFPDIEKPEISVGTVEELPRLGILGGVS